MKFSEYFLEDNNFKFIDEVRKGEHPWSVIPRIREIIEGFVEGKKDSGVKTLEEHCNIEPYSLVVQRTFVTREDKYLSSHKIFIARGTILESGAIVKGPCYIGSNTEIRQGAYIRGDVIIGQECVVGHVTEVKHSIFMNHSFAGHFAYVGDSILGSNVNIGAGTKLANLQFRTKHEIDTETVNDITIPSVDGPIKTGIQKLGAIVGDYCEIGCNSVTAPGSIIGAHTWIYPNTNVTKGFYVKGSVVRSKGHDLDRIRKRRPPY